MGSTSEARASSQDIGDPWDPYFVPPGWRRDGDPEIRRGTRVKPRSPEHWVTKAILELAQAMGSLEREAWEMLLESKRGECPEGMVGEFEGRVEVLRRRKAKE